MRRRKGPPNRPLYLATMASNGGPASVNAASVYDGVVALENPIELGFPAQTDSLSAELVLNPDSSCTLSFALKSYVTPVSHTTQ